VRLPKFWPDSELLNQGIVLLCVIGFVAIFLPFASGSMWTAVLLICTAIVAGFVTGFAFVFFMHVVFGR
jgi:hypothetical protein